MEGAGRKAAIPHISALDGARGIAVAGVLVFHSGHLLGGYLGVDFFFTLSGFLITSLLIAETNHTGSVGLGGFWARRARRLLPALAILMIGVALYAATLAKPGELAQIRGDALATLAYVANWRAVYAHIDYWALFEAPSPLNHTWSLAIEEQFYLIWPLLFVGLLARFKRTTPKVVLATSLALAGVSSLLMIVLYDPANTNRAYYGTDTRAAAILFGAALAAALAVFGSVTKRNARIGLEVLGISGAIVLAIAWTQLDGQSSRLYRGGFLICGLAATAVIAAAVHPQRGAVSRVLSIKPLCALGLISYGVYLYHWPIDIVLDHERVGLTGRPLFLVQAAVTVTVAAVSYRTLEMPIRRGALSSTQLRKLTPALAIGLVAALLAGTHGARTHDTVASAAGEIDAATLARKAAPPDAQRIMVVGNSVAYDLGLAFRQLHATPPVALFNAAVPACNFPREIIVQAAAAVGRFHRPPCHPSWEAGVIERFRPDVVFWIVSDPANRGLRYHGHFVKPCEEPYDSVYKRDLREEITRLGARGAKVVVTTEAYIRVYGAENVDHATDCDNRLRHTVAAETGAQLVDLFEYTCPHGECRGSENGVTLRPDGQHYHGPGGKIVARWLLNQVRSPD